MEVPECVIYIGEVSWGRVWFSWQCLEHTSQDQCVCKFTSGEVHYEFTLHLNVSILITEGVMVCIL